MKKILLGMIMLAMLGSCSKLEDAKKDVEIDMNGLKRTVRVYTLDGKLLKEYRGTIRLWSTKGSNRISLNLINENNRRITIDNAIVITEEK